MTGKSPFTVLYRQNPQVLPNSSDYYSFTNPAAGNFMKEMSQIHAETHDVLKKATDNMKKQYNKKKQKARNYQVGDKVWLDATNL